MSKELIERLRRNDFSTERLQNDCFRLALKVKEEQLAASQAREQQLREVLNTAADKFHDYAEIHSMKERTRANIEKIERNLEFARMCDAALALTSDTTALEALIRKAGDVMRERCACIRHDEKLEKAIRALPGVTLEDLK